MIEKLGNVGEIMKLQNSYIFLKKQDKKSDNEKEGADGNVIRINVPSRVYSYITKSFPGAIENDESNDALFFQQKFVWKKENGNAWYYVEFRINEVAGVTYLDVIVEDKNKIQLIQQLEFIQKTLQESGIQSEYIMIISYDAVSEYYCNKIYPKLNKLERNLRKLLFNIYIVNFEKEYYKATISTELQNKAYGIIQAKGNPTQKETTRMQEFFYSFEFNDIQKMLFTPNWTEIDNHAKDQFLTHNSDLSQLSDEELRTAFLTLTPKSDWERFFSDKISGVDFERVFESIRRYRNDIAHCKFFYNDC